MSSLENVIEFEGSSAFRQRIALACLSSRPIRIKKIRADDPENPGLRKHEANLLRLLEGLSDGLRLEVDGSHTEVYLNPGLLTGNKHAWTHQCNEERGITYYLEFLMMLAPFCKYPTQLTLLGVTDHPQDICIDVFRTVVSGLAAKIGLPEVTVSVEARGMLPAGGGKVLFTCGVAQLIKPFQLLYAGRVTRVRGTAWTCHMTSPFATRTYDSARRVLNELLSDVWVYTEPAKGDKAGKSHGFGLALIAETMKGSYYSASAIMDKSAIEQPTQLTAAEKMQSRFLAKVDVKDLVAKQQPQSTTASTTRDISEKMGERTACRLLAEIAEGGVTDSSFQWLPVLYMAMADNYTASRIVLGRLTPHTILLGEAERLLKERKDADDETEPSPEGQADVEDNVDGGGDSDDAEEAKVALKEECKNIQDMRVHDRVLVSCIGGGLPNLARKTF